MHRAYGTFRYFIYLFSRTRETVSQPNFPQDQLQLKSLKYLYFFMTIIMKHFKMTYKVMSHNTSGYSLTFFTMFTEYYSCMINLNPTSCCCVAAVLYACCLSV